MLPEITVSSYSSRREQVSFRSYTISASPLRCVKWTASQMALDACVWTNDIPLLFTPTTSDWLFVMTWIAWWTCLLLLVEYEEALDGELRCRYQCCTHPQLIRWETLQGPRLLILQGFSWRILFFLYRTKNINFSVARLSFNILNHKKVWIPYI